MLYHSSTVCFHFSARAWITTAIMKSFIKPFAIAAFACFSLLLVQPIHGQTLAKNGAWLEKQFKTLMMDKEKKDTPKYTFKGCQMAMAVDSKEEGVSVGMNMAWQLTDVKKVSYRKEKDGQYTLVLDVPADKIKMAMSMGGFSGSFNSDDMDDKGKSKKDNNTTLSLNTQDEPLVKQIKQKLEESVQLCRQGKG